MTVIEDIKESIRIDGPLFLGDLIVTGISPQKDGTYNIQGYTPASESDLSELSNQVTLRNLDNKQYIICSSHRARERIQAKMVSFGWEEPKTYCSMTRDVKHGVLRIPERFLVHLKDIPGWSRLRGPYDDLFRCWDYWD